MPYYKWQFAALRKLSGSMFALLPNVGEQLETVMRLSSAACYGGAGFGEGGKGAAPAIEKINDIVEQIAVDIVKELKREHLTTSGETFLEWQRPYVEDHMYPLMIRCLKVCRFKLPLPRLRRATSPIEGRPWHIGKPHLFARGSPR